MEQYRYPGSRPFNTDESAVFFGREDDIKSLSELISLEKMVVLYGKSGLGKTSLLNAGVIPKLKNDGNYEIYPVRFFTHTRENPLSPLEIFKKIFQDFRSKDNFIYKKLISDEQITENQLWYLFKIVQIVYPKDNPCFIILFDQFEELFSYPDQQIEDFKKNLAELLNVKIPQQLRNILVEKLFLNENYLTKEESILLYQPLDVKIVFSIRSDKMSFLDRMTDYLPDILKKCYELQPLNKAQAIEAITEPAGKQDREYVSLPFKYDETALLEIISFLSPKPEQKIETFQLQRICKHCEKIALKMQDKNHELVLKPDDIGNLSGIFENFYSDIINSIKVEDRFEVRKLIEEELIINEIRNPVSDTVIQNKFKISKNVLKFLIDEHIIRSEQNNMGGFNYEISHDTLVDAILTSRKSLGENDLVKYESKFKELQNKCTFIEKKYRFIGFRPYATDETCMFFGRDEDVVNLTSLIYKNDNIVLFGKSGVGKTSLLNAGLIPLLNSLNDYEVIPVRFGPFTDSSDSLSEKLKIILKVPANYFNNVINKELWFDMVNLQLAKNTTKRFIFIFDQAEEIFTYPEEQIDELFTGISELPEKNYWQLLSPEIQISDEKRDVNLQLKSIFSIRQDQLSSVIQLSDKIPDLINHLYRLNYLSTDLMNDIIKRTVSLKGNFYSPEFSFTEGAIEILINYLSDYNRGNIESSLMQLILNIVEQKIINSKISIIEENDLPDPKDIFRTYYTDLYKRYNENDRDSIRNLIEERLIDNSKRLCLDEQVILDLVRKETLDSLVAWGILRKEPNLNGSFSVELVSDFLVPVILDERQKRLEKENLEKEKKLFMLQAEAERLAGIKKTERQRKVILTVSIMAFIALVSAFFGILQWKDASHQKYIVIKEMNKAKNSEQRAIEFSRKLVTEQMYVKSQNKLFLNVIMDIDKEKFRTKLSETISKNIVQGNYDTINYLLDNLKEITGQEESARRYGNDFIGFVNKSSEVVKYFKEPADSTRYDSIFTKYYPDLYSKDTRSVKLKDYRIRNYLLSGNKCKIVPLYQYRYYKVTSAVTLVVYWEKNIDKTFTQYMNPGKFYSRHLILSSEGEIIQLVPLNISSSHMDKVRMWQNKVFKDENTISICLEKTDNDWSKISPQQTEVLTVIYNLLRKIYTMKGLYLFEEIKDQQVNPQFEIIRQQIETDQVF